jgi:hypothetical protein
MSETSTKAAIAVAVIGAIGAIGAAVITHGGSDSGSTTGSGTTGTTGATGSTDTGETNPRPGVPESYQGTWSGAITVPGPTGVQTIPIVYRLGPGHLGDVIGAFQQTQCAGQIVYESGTGPLELTDQTTNNPSGWCAPTAMSKVALVDQRTLSVTLYSGNVIVGQGSLNRP